jgi:cytochrome c oxidase subunit 4
MSTAHITPVRVYVTVWLCLIILTAATVYVASLDLGFLNLAVGLGIAITKASLVVVYFMGVRHNTPLTKVVVVAGFFWLLILFGLGMSDYLTRDWAGVPGR